MMQIKINADPITFFNCRDIKEEIKEEEIFDEDPLSIHMRAENIQKNMKQEIEDPLSCEKNYDEDRIDVIHHKIEL